MPDFPDTFWLYSAAVLLYGMFLFWYGGRAEPMTAAEVEARLAQITALSGGVAQGVDPVAGNIIDELRQLAGSDDGAEFFMLNLINFRSKALYPAGVNYSDDVRAADARYGKALLPYLLKYGGVPLFIGTAQGRFIDSEGDRQWQRVVIVRYRSRRDMLRMVAAVAPRDIAIHKWASIESTQVFPLRSRFNLFAVRGLLALLLTVAVLVLR